MHTYSNYFFDTEEHSVKIRELILYKIILLSLVFTCLFSSVNAQVLPINTLIKGSDTTKEVVTELPDPLKLTPKWWAYFESKEGEALTTAVQAFLDRIDTQIDVLPEDVRQDYLSILSKIRSNFAAYELIRNKSVRSDAPAKFVIAEQYTITQLIDLIHQNRELVGNINRLTLEVDDYDKQIKFLDRQIDTGMARYISLHTSDNTRFKEGLSLILQRTELVLIEERYISQKYQLDSLIQKNNDISAAKDFAVDHLLVSEDEVEAINNSIQQNELRMQELNVRLLKDQQSVSLMDSNGTSEDSAVLRYRNLRVLNSQVGITVTESQIVSYQLQKLLLDVLSEESEQKESKTLKILQDYDREIAELRIKYKNRMDQNEAERVRSNELLAENSEAQTTFLRNITQDRANLIQEISINLQRLQTTILDAEFLSKLASTKLAEKQGGFKNRIYQGRLMLSNAWRSLKGSFETSLFKIGDTPVTAQGIMRFFFVLIVAWWIAFWLNKILLRVGARGNGDKLPAYYLVSRISYYSIILIGFLGGLTIIGIDFTNFALVAGALAIGLGFGLQSIVNNFVSGLILLFERSIKVGDFIELQDRNLRGEVRAINVRATIIADNDNVEIVIPNSEFINTKMLNWTLSEPQRRMRYPFKVAYGVDKELVREAVLKAAEEVPHTLKGIPGRNPSVWLNRFGEYYYEFELVVWLTTRAVKRPNSVHAAYMWAIDTALRENNIEIPVPQSELRFRDKSAVAVKPYEEDDGIEELEEDIRERQAALSKK